MFEKSERGSKGPGKNAITCPTCSASITAGYNLCPRCGSELPDITTQRQHSSSGVSKVSTKVNKRPVPKSTSGAKTSSGAPSASPSDSPEVADEAVKKSDKPSKPTKKRGGYWSKLDRSELRRIKLYIFSIQIVLIIILILNSMYESTITDPNKFFLPLGFYFPVGLLLLLLLFSVFLLSLEGLWFKYVQIRNARSFEKRSKLIKNYRTTAQGILVVSIVILIVLLSLSYFPFIADSLKTENDFEIGANEEKSNFFEEQDAFGLTHASSITVNSNNTVELNLSTQELMKDMEKSKLKNEALGNYTSKDVTLSPSEFQLGYTPNKKYYFFISNIGNDSVSGKLIIEREISKPFVFNIVFFMILFIITSAIWLAYLGIVRKKYEKLHEEKVAELTKHYAVRPYTLEDVFLIYQDGTLLSHQTRRIKPMDNDILSGMLTAIKDFVKDAFKTESRGELNELKYGKLNILIEHGQFVFLAAVVSGKPPKQLRSRMKQVINQVNTDYYDELKRYRGEVKRLASVKKIIHHYLTGVEDAEAKFDINSDSAWNNRGVVFTKLGKYNEALKCFDNALKINPGVSNIWLNRGIALVKLYEFDEAMDCFDRALQLDPNNVSAQRRRNKCWYKWHLQDSREEQLATGTGRERRAASGRPTRDYDYGEPPSPAPRPVGGGLSDGYSDEPGYGAAPVDELPPRCPNCGQPLKFVGDYQSWYCRLCDIYPFDE